MAVTVHYVGFHPRLILEGFEEIRVKYPIVRVYLLYDGKRDKYGEVSRYNKNKLKTVLAFFKPIEIAVNPLDYGDVFSKVYAILRNERESGQEVLIDITDMPPTAASATTAAALMFPGVRLYCVQARGRGDYIPDPETPEFATWVEEKDTKTKVSLDYASLPNVRLSLFGGRGDEEKPALEEKLILTLSERRGSADSIVTLINWMGEPVNATVKAKYSRLVRELAKKGFVKVYMRGKYRNIKLTSFGEAYAKALKLVYETRKKMLAQEAVEQRALSLP